MSKYGFMLTLSCVAYLLLAGSSTFVPAVIMADVGESLDMSISQLGALSSSGAGLKAVLIMFLMGPAIEKFGPAKLINVCIIGSGVCNILLATATNSQLYTVYFMANYVFNSFSEQPAFIVLYATYFEKMLAVSTTCIACAFSLGGFGAPHRPRRARPTLGARRPTECLAPTRGAVRPQCSPSRSPPSWIPSAGAPSGTSSPPSRSAPCPSASSSSRSARSRSREIRRRR